MSCWGPARSNLRCVDFAYAPEDEAFRAELLEWLDKNLPPFLEEWAGRGEDDTGGAGSAGVLSAMERRRASSMTARMSARPTPLDWHAGSTVMGPTAATGSVTSRKLEPTRRPPETAATA